MQATISNWAPPDELGKFQAAYLASGFGVVIDWCVSGHIIENFGWTYAFYGGAVALGLFSIVWFLVVYDSPSDHPRISIVEKEFIESKLNSIKSKVRMESQAQTSESKFLFLIEAVATILINFFIDTRLGIGVLSFWNFVSILPFHHSSTKVFQ